VKYPTKFRHLRALAIAAWYIPDEQLRWRIILDLQEKVAKPIFGYEYKGYSKFIELNLILTSKELCEIYLFRRKEISAKLLFGNILRSNLTEALDLLNIYSKSQYVKPKVRRRGYADHGHRRDPSLWIETHDWTLTDYMNQKELLQCQFELLLLLRRFELRRYDALTKDGS
jgi:hypothetical protein